MVTSRRWSSRDVVLKRGGSFKVDYSAVVALDGETVFLGYETTSAQAHIVALLHDGEKVERLTDGQEGIVVLDQTPFYGESGGQVGDCGFFSCDSNRADVRDTTKSQGHHLHHVRVTAGVLTVGQAVSVQCRPVGQTAHPPQPLGDAPVA